MPTEPRWLNDDEQRAWRAFLASYQLLMASLERGHQEHGLSGSDYQVLVHLSEAEGHRLRMWELSRSTLLEKSRLSHQMTRMEKAGLVRREKNCPGDRRGLYAVLTEKGWDTIKRIAPDHVAQVRELMFDHLTPEQVAALTDALEPLAVRLQAGCPSEAELTKDLG